MGAFFFVSYLDELLDSFLRGEQRRELSSLSNFSSRLNRGKEEIVVM